MGSALRDAEASMPRKEIEGFEKLSMDQQKVLVGVLEETDALFKSKDNGEPLIEENKQSKMNPKKNEEKVKKNRLGDVSAQPKIGEKTFTKGPVTWKFGSYLCHGTLLPRRETNTHCFARTHKGNVK